MTKFYLLFLFLASVGQSKAQACLDTTVYTGSGTFYTVGSGGNCSFPVPASPIHTAAINPLQYDSSATCGACIEVTGPDGSITVSIEDQCISCGFGDIDLSAEAFDSIADPMVGIVNIQWRYVACPLAGAVKIFMGPGTNPYYISMQVRNHRYPVKKIEFSSSGGSFAEMTRGTDNMFFILPASPPAVAPLSFRITDILDNVIIENNIPLTSNLETQGVNQFPVCLTSTGINTLSIPSAIRISPNPTVNGLMVLENKILKDAVIDVYDLTGKCISRSYLMANSKTSLHLLSKGVYLVQSTFSDGTKDVQKVISY